MNRPARIASWLSIASLVGIVPHVVEDARYGQPANFHMTVVQFEWFSGLIAGLTAATAFLSLTGWRSGTLGVFLVGLLWSVLGSIDHYRAFLPGTFRDGLSSRIWILSVVGLQAAAAISAAAGLVRSRGATPRPA